MGEYDAIVARLEALEKRAADDRAQLLAALEWILRVDELGCSQTDLAEADKVLFRTREGVEPPRKPFQRMRK